MLKLPKLAQRFGLTCALLSVSAPAQKITGIWQGSLPGSVPERLVLTITKPGDTPLTCRLNAIDHNQTYPLTCTFQANTLHFTVPQYGATFEGQTAPDNKAITGTWKWTPDSKGLPLTLEHATEQTSWAVDRTPHNTSFITVQPGVKLEVLDWGGTGRPIVLLTGLGDNAHVFDNLAPKLIAKYHVYGITRRGFGASDAPSPFWQNYTADRLANDVLAVLTQLKLTRPILVGHSIAGEELSSIGSRYPDRVAGLIYLDAGSPYALYLHSPQSLLIDWNDMRQKVDAIANAPTPQQQRALIQAMLKEDLPRYEHELKDRETFLQGLPDQPPPSDQVTQTSAFQITQAIHNGEQRYAGIKCPLLAIFNEPAPPPAAPATDPKSQAQVAHNAANLKAIHDQEDAFKALGNNAHVLTIVGGNHYLFRSNEGDVLNDMNNFIANLP